MALDDILSALNDVSFAPRTLHLNLPINLAKRLSVFARAFLDIAYDKTEVSIYELTGGAWKDDPIALDFFFSCDENVRVEILTFLTLFVHEYTHRIDFLISPFGLQFYANTLREYWLLQEFFPRMLDDPRTVDQVRFLVGLGENTRESLEETGAKEIWKDLKGIIHNFYAWGDVSTIKPIGKYVKEGWGNNKVPVDPFGVGVVMEPITVLEFFYTFRLPEADKLWYLRPLTIFETKAIVNSLLFILYLLEERGIEECLRYYEKVYLRRKTDLPQDYFFLLDLGARIYDHTDFHSLLKQGHIVRLRSTLFMLSSICWYALQAPPFEAQEISNPILRLWTAFMFMNALARGRLNTSVKSTTEAILLLDNRMQAKSPYYKPIKDISSDCQVVVDRMLQMNQEHTWHPDVRSHFNHIFTLMRPHFTKQDLTYIPLIGMPNHGNPFFECGTKEDWELTYGDYQTPKAVTDWFNIRTDLFFNLLKPADEIIKRLDAHFMAFFLSYFCECGQGVTKQWASRFAREFNFTCAYCGRKKTVQREDVTFIPVHSEDD